MGKLPVIRTLATLAHDCRRTELFQGELLAALKIVQRGDLPLRDLIGAFAGEIGQTQFLPSSYIKYGVDFDGDGRVDLRHSVPDVLASTANLLHTNGFKMGAPYERRHREFRSDARMEPRHDLSQDHRLFRRSAGGAVARLGVAAWSPSPLGRRSDRMRHDDDPGAGVTRLSIDAEPLTRNPSKSELRLVSARKGTRELTAARRDTVRRPPCKLRRIANAKSLARIRRLLDPPRQHRPVGRRAASAAAGP